MFANLAPKTNTLRCRCCDDVEQMVATRRRRANAKSCAEIRSATPCAIAASNSLVLLLQWREWTGGALTAATQRRCCRTSAQVLSPSECTNGGRTIGSWTLWRKCTANRNCCTAVPSPTKSDGAPMAKWDFFMFFAGQWLRPAMAPRGGQAGG